MCDEDQKILQNDIDSLHKWSPVDILVQFHQDKCKVVRITNKHTNFDLPFYEFWYTLNGKVLDYEIS